MQRGVTNFKLKILRDKFFVCPMTLETPTFGASWLLAGARLKRVPFKS